MGQRLWIANQVGVADTPGIKEFYVNTGREDSNGRPIVELAPGFTEDDVTRYFKKLQTTLENDTRISKDARFSRERNKGF